MSATRTRILTALPDRPRLAAAGSLVLGILFALGVGWLILRGRGLYAVAAFLLVFLYLGILLRWQRGFYGLLVYLPFAGVVTLSLYPWKGLPMLHPALYKDWLFVFPTYLGFLAAVVLRRERSPRLERLPTALLIALSLLVLAHMANPGVPNALTGLIGAKVWLFYLPLYVLTFRLVASRRDLVLLLRLLVVLAVFPCAVGVAEYVLAQFVGYPALMDAIYGATAVPATQELTYFEVGGGLIARIPSTFTFVTQYFGFTLAMLVPCYLAGRADPSARWRRAARWAFALVVVASFLSGARAAFLFVPLLLALMYGFDRGFFGVMRAGFYVAGMLLVALAIASIATGALLRHVAELFRIYAQDTAYGGLVQAITSVPLGAGTGTNTGPARYAFERPEFFIAIQNYYAKAAYELGIPGLLLIWGLFAALIVLGFRNRRRLQDPALRACAAGLLAFVITMALNCFKGWLIDLDPVNVYFWVFAGLLAKLPYLERSADVPAHPFGPDERHPEGTRPALPPAQRIP